MAIDNIAHNVDEYYVGKGIVTIQPGMTGDWFDVGNVPEFEFTPVVEELAHNSSRSGTRTRDRTIILEKGGDLRIVLEEWTSLNLSIILLGDVVEDAGPPIEYSIDILSKTAFTAAVRFQGMNDVGARWNFQFNRVDFIPSGSLNPISEEWGQLEVTGRLAATDIGGGVLSFGTARRVATGASPGWPAP
jgi:hypothetical protein